MANTTSISRRVNPEVCARHLMAVGDILIIARSPLFAIRAQCHEIEFAVLARHLIDQRASPRIGELLRIAGIRSCPIIIGLSRLQKGSETLLRGWKLSKIHLIISDGLTDRFDLQARGLVTGAFQKPGNLGDCDSRYQADNYQHDQNFHQGKAARPGAVCIGHDTSGQLIDP